MGGKKEKQTKMPLNKKERENRFVASELKEENDLNNSSE